jgi:hypothetical protein
MNKNIIFCVISSKDSKKASNMIKTFLKYHEDWDHCIYTIGNFDTFGIKSENVDNLSTSSMKDDFEKCECLRFKIAGMLLEKYEKVLYCDSDIMFFDRIPEYDKPICLTKHILNTDKVDNLMLYLDRFHVGGFINIGFMLFNKHNDSIKFCNTIFESGMLRKRDALDDRGKIRLQPLVSHIPYMGLSYCFIDEPGVNMAYWRLDGDVNVNKNGDKFFVNGSPLICFHFSGYVGDDRLCKFNKYRAIQYGSIIYNILSLYKESLKK